MDYRAIGMRIRQFRKDKRLTQAELAQRVGISTSFMGHIERGTRIPSIETLVRLSESLGVSLDDMVIGPRENAAGRQSMTRLQVLNDIFRALERHGDEWWHGE